MASALDEDLSVDLSMGPWSVGGIILAGGQSSRMGRDKALLPWKESSLLKAAFEAVSSFTNHVVVVTSSRERAEDADLKSSGATIIFDAYPNCGPLGGIVTGLEALRVERCFVVACDMPSVQHGVLARLLAEAESDCDVAAPYVSGRLEPLCAVYRLTAIQPLREFLESGGRALHRALGIIRTKQVSEEVVREIDPDLSSFVNLNTPEEFQKAQELIKSDLL